ncbi:DUF5403 family protein [Actinoplanes oblitus]|uniref:DUF5403 family protein n=1 Tax=Actinoplanes oblitus TaxID=3040509 RepID=A0ABY8WFQ5_9ACTN|nr:DUF5403 family protein [Actinoplanes oblitus]WIM95772.1 DUF5403 family protein [Actinoplanes oblitus]
MAKIFRAAPKRVAVIEGVQAALEARTFEIAARAEVELIAHRQDGHAEIDIEHGRVDWFVVLSDERGQKAAMSIEFGRAGYIDPETGERYAAMDGLFILHRAAHLPKKSHPKIRVPELRKRKRGGRR